MRHSKDPVVQGRPPCLYCDKPLRPNFDHGPWENCGNRIVAKPTSVRSYGFKDRFCTQNCAVAWAIGSTDRLMVQPLQRDADLERARRKYEHDKARALRKKFVDTCAEDAP